MSEVHIVDIDGEQWDIKDLPLTQRVAILEQKQPIIKGDHFAGVVSPAWVEFVRIKKLPAGKYMFVGNISVVMSFAIQRAGTNLLVTSTKDGANIFYFEIPNDGRTEDIIFACQSNYQVGFTFDWLVTKVAND